MMQTPIISNGYYLMIADSKNGHILNMDGSLYLEASNGDKDFFFRRETLSEIRQLANELLKTKKNIEILIYNHKNEFVEMYS